MSIAISSVVIGDLCALLSKAEPMVVTVSFDQCSRLYE